MLERLQRLYPVLIDLSLGRLEALLAKLGHPERRLPPVIHVAGTNGKGSTCANLRAIGEAAGWRVHVTTSPHLVDVTERFRVAGTLVDEAVLLSTLERIEALNDGAAITVFEVLTASAFLLFAEAPAELAVIEVGLGGRFDATNVLIGPAACAISAISMDHEAFLGPDLESIAGEKAGIIKPGRPVVTGRQPDPVRDVIIAKAQRCNAPLWLRDRDWHLDVRGDGGLDYADPLGRLVLPMPALLGPHQIDNAGLAVAALRASGLAVPEAAFGGIAQTEWPARLQRLEGRLARLLGPGWTVWLDGGHNPDAGIALAEAFRDRRPHLIVGMKQTKDPEGFLAPLLGVAGKVFAVAEPGQHLAMPVELIVAASGGRAVAVETVEAALQWLSEETPGEVLICGSLYLAGLVLKADRMGSKG